MKRSEIHNKLFLVRSILDNLANQMKKVKGVDLSKVLIEIETAAAHITEALRELKKT